MEVEYVNEIVATGRLITKTEKSGGGAQITIVSKSGKNPSFLKFTFDHADLSGIPIRSKVKVKGYVRSYTYPDQTAGRRPFYQALIGTEIAKERTLTEERFGVEGRFSKEPHCEVYLKGIIRHVIDEGEWVRYLLYTDGAAENRRESTIRLSMKKLDRQPAYKKGDVICAVCGISTKRKQVNGRNEDFEDIMIYDYAKVGEVDMEEFRAKHMPAKEASSKTGKVANAV